MKKIMGLLVVLSLALLVGCGGAEDKGKESVKADSKASSDSAKVEIKSGMYAIIPDVSEEDLSTIGLKIDITNTGKEKLFIMSDDFVLYEKGENEKIKPEDVYNDELDTIEGESLSKDKSVSGTIFYNIDPKKEYKLVYEAKDAAGEGNDVELELDLAKYEDSQKAFDESKKAADAFIDVQFLGKENDDYAKLVGNDQAETKAEVAKQYKNENEDYLFSEVDLSDEDYQKCFDKFTSTQGKRAKITKTLVAQYEDEAIVNIEIEEGLSNESIRELENDYTEDYMDSTGDYDGVYEYGYSKYPEILEKSELKSDNNELNLTLVKKDGKWNADLKDNENENVVSSLLGGIY